MCKTHCAIFSISVATSRLRECLQALDANYPLLVLTPHALFDFERADVRTWFGGGVTFATFADYISDIEAGRCDEQAYRASVAAIRSEMNGYFADIKNRKNATIADNLFKEYDIRSGSVLSSDLGIDKTVWLERGFTDRTSETTLESERVPPSRRAWRRAASWVISHIIGQSGAMPALSLLTRGKDAYLFMGETSRVWQYFASDVKKETVILPSRWGLLRWAPGLERGLRRARLGRILKRRGVTTAISSLHEHRNEFHALALEVNLNYGVVQDGHIPENYPPYLYLLQCGNARFYVMDPLAAGMFSANGIPVEVLSLFADTQLPEITKSPKARTVLVLTSGAGDWTAVKNRSDDDHMLMAFVEVARAMKEVTFIYRCHPFWVHPTHQGERSIERAADYLKSTGLDNIRISTGSLAQAKRYSQDGKLYVEPTLLHDEMLMADIVFGEHSYSMIDAAKAQKLFASVLIADRRDLFVNYSNLGFFHLTSAQGIQHFIEDVQNEPERVCSIYNAAVRRHNAMCSRQTARGRGGAQRSLTGVLGLSRHGEAGDRQALTERSRFTSE